MHVYPEIESWNEFYPNEIFIRLGDNEDNNVALPVFKIANIGTTIYLGLSMNETQIFKKISDIEIFSDVKSSTLLVGYVRTYNEG